MNHKVVLKRQFAATMPKGRGGVNKMSRVTCEAVKSTGVAHLGGFKDGCDGFVLSQRHSECKRCHTKRILGALEEDERDEQQQSTHSHKR